MELVDAGKVSPMSPLDAAATLERSVSAVSCDWTSILEHLGTSDAFLALEALSGGNGFSSGTPCADLADMCLGENRTGAHGLEGASLWAEVCLQATACQAAMEEVQAARNELASLPPLRLSALSLPEPTLQSPPISPGCPPLNRPLPSGFEPLDHPWTAGLRRLADALARVRSAVCSGTAAYMVALERSGREMMAGHEVAEDLLRRHLANPGQRGDQALDRLGPSTLAYKALMKALEKYRGVVSAGGFPTLETRSSRQGRKGHRSSVPRNLNARLAAEGYQVNPESEDIGPETKTALREFQIRHGLAATGQPDRATLRALQTSAEEKVQAIVQAMRMIRGAIPPGSPSFVHIQVPHAFLELYLDGAFIRRFTTVVGSASKPPGARKRDFQYRTLPLNSAVDRIVVNPEWVVPDSIAEKEILPFVLEDPTWLEKHGYRVVTWSGGKEVFIQKPGSGNALGKVKFLFFNDLGYYLHDTPAKKLFRRPVRLFSHGCIRVEHAMELAGILLGRDQGVQQSTLNSWLKKREQTVVRLKSPIPIHVTYHTAGADSDGQVYFLPDYYELE